MLLRPSKIFVSFHQLRHYFQTKVSELVAVNQPHTSHPVNQLKNFAATQQSIIFFSDVQRTLVQKAYLQQPHHPVKRHVANQKLLLKVIQQHFPMMKMFSSAPAFHGRMWAGQQQMRTMMSTASNAGGASTATSFMTWGLPRTAAVGVGRSPAFARHFSTTKSPSCVTLFQNTANTTTSGQQSNVFAHISSRIFSPAGTKMNQPDLNEKQAPKYASLHATAMPADDKVDYSAPSVFSFQAKSNKGMGDLVNCSAGSNDDDDVEHTSSDAYSSARSSSVRRESMSSTTCSSSSKRARSNKSPIDHDKLESIIRHDDLSPLCAADESFNSSNNRRKLHSKHTRLKHSHDPQQHHVRRQDDPINSVRQGGINKKKLSATTTTTAVPSASICSSNIYLLITLDTLKFLDKRKDWSTQALTTSFIDSIESTAYAYQIHINYVLKLLDTLQKQGKFRVIARKSELRVYFPVPPKSRQEALDFLHSFHIADSMLEYFSIVVEDRHFLVSPKQQEVKAAEEEDYFSYDPSTAAVAATNTVDVAGPDYFRDLHTFLDRTDYLIERSPAFNSNK